MTEQSFVNLPQWDGTPREIAEVWRLTKGSRVAVCTLFSHPKKGEIRLTVDGEWHRGEALGHGLALVDLALESESLRGAWLDSKRPWLRREPS
jgi:hypothetical protein